MGRIAYIYISFDIDIDIDCNSPVFNFFIHSR